ncbi:MAG: choice-of-anchor I family protein [Roseburia sp.]
MKRKTLWKRMFVGVLAATMLIGMVPTAAFASGADAVSGTPYRSDGTYDVTVPHVIVNQVYGGSTNGSASRSFIELYNQSDAEVDLTGWQLAYRSSTDNVADSSQWQTFTLNGKIAGKGFYLVSCRATSGKSYTVPEGNQQWDISLHNKGVSVALFSKSVTPQENFAGAITEDNRPEGYVDLLAVQGNDEENTQVPPAYETGYSAIQSKKNAVRRIGFADTDDNKADAEALDYSQTISEDKGPHVGTVSNEEDSDDDGDGEDDQDTKVTCRNDSFETGAELTLSKTGGVSIGTANADGGVAEIVAYNKDNQDIYVVNGQDGVLDVMTLSETGALTVTKQIEVQSLISDFVYGDMTSVSVDTVNNRIAIAIQAEDYTAKGRVAVLDYNGKLVTSYETGVQPDMVTFSKSGRYILTADEGEPREGYGDGIVDPEGSVTIVDTKTGEVTIAGFEGFDSTVLSGQGVLFNKVNGQILSAAADLEPEYIAINSKETKAYVSLQEANAIGILDLDKKEFTEIKSLGFVDYSQPENAIDLLEDDKYQADTYADAYGVRMPDGISIYEAGGKEYLLTANEGDAREWGSGDNAFINEKKVTLTATDGITTAKSVRVLDHDVTAGLEDDKNYLFGGRSFSIYDAATMTLVYDSANTFESKTAAYLPDWFNCSNDDASIDSRSRKKGPEPETVITGRVGNNYYAFVALERIGGIMVYDITDPASVSYVNYINTRDFSGEINGDVAPEGLAFVPPYSSGSGKPVLLAACEVSGTVAAYTMGGSATTVPTPEEKDPSPEGDAEDADTISVLSSSEGNISFGIAIPNGDKLHLSITEVVPGEISAELKRAQPNLLAVFDISVLDQDNQIVSVDNNELTIRLRLADSLKGYDAYQVVYIKDGEVKETIAATLEDDYLVFKTTHLSQYGIVGTKTETLPEENTDNNTNTSKPAEGNTDNKTNTTGTSEDNADKKANTVSAPVTKAPETGDESSILFWIILLTVSGATGYALRKQRRVQNRK